MLLCVPSIEPGPKQQDAASKTTKIQLGLAATEINTIHLTPRLLAVTGQLIQFWQISLTTAIQADRRPHCTLQQVFSYPELYKHLSNGCISHQVVTEVEVCWVT